MGQFWDNWGITANGGDDTDSGGTPHGGDSGDRIVFAA